MKQRAGRGGIRTALALSGALAAAAGTGAVPELVGTGPAGASSVPTVYASPSGSSGAADTSCSTAAYSTIGAAVAAVPAGGHVVACHGTYKEDVVIRKALGLYGESATIDATGLPGASRGAVRGQKPYNGVTIEASHVLVEGFTVTGAQGEGILAVNPKPRKGPNVGGMQLYTGSPLTDVTIEHDTVEGNVLGFNQAGSLYGPCTPNGGQDCGEGIHLLSVARSRVLDDESENNSGGVLVTDEYGPSDNNLIEGNVISGDTKDCGITLPSHNAGLNPGNGTPNPSFAGVYDNQVLDNVVEGNGVQGYGAGVGVFAPAPYTATYDNLVSGNYIVGNGLAGISVHSHAPNASVNGDVFIHNTIGANNVDLADGTDSGPSDKATTGILIWSAVTKYDFTVRHNNIFDNTYGVWFTPGTIAIAGLRHNRYSVTQPVFRAS